MGLTFPWITPGSRRRYLRGQSRAAIIPASAEATGTASSHKTTSPQTGQPAT